VNDWIRSEVRPSIQERALAMARRIASRVSCLSVGVAAGRCRTPLTERNAGALQGKVMTVAWMDDVAWPSPTGTSAAGLRRWLAPAILCRSHSGGRRSARRKHRSRDRLTAIFVSSSSRRAQHTSGWPPVEENFGIRHLALIQFRSPARWKRAYFELSNWKRRKLGERYSGHWSVTD
jgi:hypothetical protein